MEYKTITLFGMWALLTLNVQLIRTLWPFHGQPIRFLLITCNMFNNLTGYVSDISLKKQLISHRDELGAIATELLEISNAKAAFRCDQLFNRKSGQSLLTPTATIQTDRDVGAAQCITIRKYFAMWRPTVAYIRFCRTRAPNDG